jgi:hypothetical protein
MLDDGREEGVEEVVRGTFVSSALGGAVNRNQAQMPGWDPCSGGVAE